MESVWVRLKQSAVSLGLDRTCLSVSDQIRSVSLSQMVKLEEFDTFPKSDQFVWIRPVSLWFSRTDQTCPIFLGKINQIGLVFFYHKSHHIQSLWITLMFMPLLAWSHMVFVSKLDITTLIRQPLSQWSDQTCLSGSDWTDCFSLYYTRRYLCLSLILCLSLSFSICVALRWFSPWSPLLHHFSPSQVKNHAYFYQVDSADMWAVSKQQCCLSALV